MATVAIPVAEVSSVAEVRRAVAAVAVGARFDQEQAGRVALIATEAATNLLRHAGNGEVLIGPASRGGLNGVEIIALDKGPGIASVPQAMRDGYSTIGGAGTGLGAIGRLASECDIYTVPGKGTALLARVFPRSAPVRSGPVLEAGGLAVPKTGETDCGDAFQIRSAPDGARVLVADGLGHGFGAAEASRAAVTVFQESAGLELEELMVRIHGRLRSTRGAAVALSDVSGSANTVTFASVGNVGGAVLDSGGHIRQMLSLPGTVGHELHKVRTLTYPFPPGALFLLYSDGIVSRWSLQPYPGLTEKDPSLIAAVLYRDFNRGQDDATVVVLRHCRNGVSSL